MNSEHRDQGAERRTGKGLSDETERLLANIGEGNRQVAVRGMAQAQAWQLVEPVVRGLADEAGLTRVMYNSYLLLAEETVKLARTKVGSELAASLRLLVRKWVHYGQDPDLAQRVLVACIEKLGTQPGTAAAPKPARAQTSNLP